MPDFMLTYAITTYNRLPFLREGMARLLQARAPGEEIVVVDGGSTDGTVDYLADLHAEGRIDTFVTERDHGQGHGINKAILRARGNLVKPINDDDVYDYDAIRTARDLMASKPAVDVLVSRAQVMVWTPSPHLIRHDYYNPDAFPLRTQPFPFGDIGMMLRRDSLALLGLFSPQIAWIDYEYAMRVTATDAVLAYMHQTTGIRLTNDSSKSVRMYEQLKSERQRIDQFYRERWTPASHVDRLRAIKARLSAWLARSPAPTVDETSTGTECPAAADAFAIADRLFVRVRGEETERGFSTSSRA